MTPYEKAVAEIAALRVAIHGLNSTIEKLLAAPNWEPNVNGLLPCPCCGNPEPVVVQPDNEGTRDLLFAVDCAACGLYTDYFGTEDKAKSKWNTRSNAWNSQKWSEV